MTTLEQIRNAWDSIAAGYDEFVTPSGGWALPEDALRRVGLRPGMRFLDVAAGSGALSIPAARLGAQVPHSRHDRAAQCACTGGGALQP